MHCWVETHVKVNQGQCGTSANHREASHGMMGANNNKRKVKKVNLYLRQGMEAHRVVRCRAYHFLQKIDSQMVVSLTREQAILHPQEDANNEKNKDARKQDGGQP